MKKYGILAYPAKHSLSPVIFNAAFKKNGIDAEYGVFEVSNLELAGFMKSVKQDPINGLSVSLPYKEIIMNYLDKIDKNAIAIGAVNTIINKKGLLHGYNTDYMGSNMVLEKKCGSLKGKKVVIMGAGGAVKGIIYGLIKNGAEVVVYNRSGDKAEKIGLDFNIEFGDLETMKKSSGDIFIQASSLWISDPEMSEEKLNELFPDDFVGEFEYIMDIVYKPLKTPLLVKAEKLGSKIITGEKMLLYQAVEQFKIWTGKDAPMEVMQNAMKSGIK